MKAKKAPGLTKPKVEREGVMISERLNTSINLGKQMNFKALNTSGIAASPVRYKRTGESPSKINDSVMYRSTQLNASGLGSKGLVQSLT